MRQANVVRKLTHSIRDHIDVSGLDPVQAKECMNEFTSWSRRKGTMTKNCLHPNLNMAKEYTYSGHLLDFCAVNIDMEGYIEQIPALNAPGGACIRGLR